MKQLFIRNTQASDYLEAFLVSAVTSLLLVRFYLHLTGYPQLGGDHFHIAHMLYGGLFMLMALVISLAFLGVRAQRATALIGGAGFGVFIDELGKFITHDNNYFYRPTIGIIYAIFTALYLLFNFLGRSRPLSPHEYELNALVQLEEAIAHDLDPHEKARIEQLLAQANPASPVVHGIRQLLQQVTLVAPAMPPWRRRFIASLHGRYQRFWHQRHSNRLVAALFMLEAVGFPLAVLFNIATNFGSAADLLHTPGPQAGLVFGQLASTLVAGGFAIAGALRLRRSHLRGYELFRRAILINIFLTEFFMFARLQFGAMPGLLVNIILLIGTYYAAEEEKRHRTRSV